MPGGFGKLFCATIVSPASRTAAAAVTATGAISTIREHKAVIDQVLFLLRAGTPRTLRVSPRAGQYYKPWVMPRIVVALLIAATLVSGCSNAKPESAAQPIPHRPSILLITLDTTRADAIGPDARGVETPAFNALVARGRRFRQA